MASLNLPKLEQEILNYWEEKQIFKKSLSRNKGKKTFVFYEGPPTANAKPGLHHVLGRIFKDIILRFKTMQGYYVERKAGWDTHGLPVEIEIEKKLGFKHKSDILRYGIEKFNTLCRLSVWNYIKDWNNLTKRIGFWLDLDKPYITYNVEYIETLWWIIQQFHKLKLLYNDFKVLPYCPRCETPLSSHELAQGYKKIEDESIYIKFKIKKQDCLKLKLPIVTYFLVWTTTPWTLPANVALAVNPELIYALVKTDDGYLILEQNRLKMLFADKPILKTFKGKDLEGLAYEELYDYGLKDKFLYKVYGALFVSSQEGTGIVHIAPAYGEEDFNLRRAYNLPLIHTVDVSGNITNPTVLFGHNKIEEVKINYSLPGKGLFVKEADDYLKKDLQRRKILVAKEKIIHKYPFCWRCHSPVIYYARRAWYVAISKLKQKLISYNQKINWIPEYIKNGRFGKFLEEAKDWNFSRERFWGTPLPVWQCDQCNYNLVVGSRTELLRFQKPIARLIIARHGESENSLKRIASADPAVDKFHLTKKGRQEVLKMANKLKKEKIDIIISSDLIRTKETSEILARILKVKILYDKRLRDIYDGIFNLRPYDEFYQKIGPRESRFDLKAEGGETLTDLRKRLGEFFEEIKKSYAGKTILIVSHKDPIWIMQMLLLGLTQQEAIEKFKELEFQTADWRKLELKNLPLNKDFEIDLHRPYIDAIKLNCPKCQAKISRVEYLVDVWFDSGAMPYAQCHFPFKQTKNLKINYPTSLIKLIPYPADYISEGVDQTRGWFYTLLAISACLGLGPSYKNVICLGLILDEKGLKMSKSRGNIVDPNMIIDEFGVDALRWYFYTVNEPGESKLFKKSDITNCLKNFILIYFNIFNLIEFYATKKLTLNNFLFNNLKEPINKYILILLARLVKEVRNELNHYQVRRAALLLERFCVEEVSRFYIRIVRKFLRQESPLKQETLKALIFTMWEFTKALAPFCPFLAEIGHLKIKKILLDRLPESIHLADFPEINIKSSNQLVKDFKILREIIDLGFALRKEMKVKVRQPLRALYTNLKIPEYLKRYIMGELNVLNVITLKSFSHLTFTRQSSNGLIVSLDSSIDQELLKQGRLRDLIRQIQLLRKKAGLLPYDKVKIIVEDKNNFVQENEAEIKKSAGIEDIYYKKLQVDFEKIDLQDFFIKIKIERS